MKTNFSTPRMLKHPFVLATAVAAFLHNTWTVSVFFGGMQPDVTELGKLILWLVPGVLISFSLDIGLLSTANDLAQPENRRPGLFVTFFVLALAMYILQWMYIIHHMPALELSSGVRVEWRDGVALLRDWALFIIPGLLPISMSLYTFSAGAPSHRPQNRNERRAQLDADMGIVEPELSVNGKEQPKSEAAPFLDKLKGNGKRKS